MFWKGVSSLKSSVFFFLFLLVVFLELWVLHCLWFCLMWRGFDFGFLFRSLVVRVFEFVDFLFVCFFCFLFFKIYAGVEVTFWLGVWETGADVGRRLRISPSLLLLLQQQMKEEKWRSCCWCAGTRLRQSGRRCASLQKYGTGIERAATKMQGLPRMGSPRAIRWRKGELIGAG